MHFKVSAGCKPITHSVAPSTIRRASGPSCMYNEGEEARHDIIHVLFVICMTRLSTIICSWLELLCTVRVFHTIRVWYVPYAYGTYHTRMVCFSVPYAYGCTVCVYCSTWHKAFYRDWRLYSKCLLRSKGYVLSFSASLLPIFL